MFHEPFEELRYTSQLPSPSGVGMRVLVLTQDPDCSMEDLVAAIRLDPALAGRIIKLATSLQGEETGGVHSVEEAAARLGLETVSNVALGFSLIAGERGARCEEFDYEAFWEGSAARALVAKVICEEAGRGRPDEVSTCALLVHIGQLALASIHPEDYAEMLRERQLSGADLAEMEFRYFNVDHRQVTASMLSDWGLPGYHSEAALSFGAAFADGETEEPETAELLGVLDAADALAREALGRGERPAGRATRDPVRGLGLDAPTLERIKERIQTAWKESSETLSSTMGRIQIEELQRLAMGARGEAAPQETDPQDRLRILAVDDDPVSLKLLETHLQSTGNLVARARNGREALALAVEWNPHIVVTDWVMPEMDGLDLCKALRRYRSGRSCYVLILTGRTEEDRIVEAFEAGADDYVAKALKPKHLLARIRGGERVVRLQQQVERDKKTQKEQVSKLAVLNRKLKAAAMTDSLTELPNRRYAMKQLEAEWASSARSGKPFSVVMIDVDRFKTVNDTHGHDVGDTVLQCTAKAISSTLRRGDVCARMGGEEFLVICPNTDVEGAMNAAERMRVVIEENRIEARGFRGFVTASLGVGTLVDGVSSIDELLKIADRAVYVAKAQGRNRSVLGVPDTDRRSA